MIIGIGLDMVEKKRITPLNEKLVKKILSKKEKIIFDALTSDVQKVEFFGGRFAVKEGFFKALGIGISAIPFADVDVLPNALGQPHIHAVYLQEHNLLVHVSITHTEETIAAMVIIEQATNKE